MEGVTFRSPELSAVLRERAVESRLHMDFPERVGRDKWNAHARLQAGLIGNPAVPYYAILDPETDEFLFKMYMKGGDEPLLRGNFLKAFERLPVKGKKAD